MLRSRPRLGATLFYFTFSSALIDLVFADGGLGGGGDGGHLDHRGGGDGHIGLIGGGDGGPIQRWDRSSSSSYSVGDRDR